MAAKKPAKPRKFKQARKDAKSAAKKTFSGKSQARLKDSTVKLTADDRLALQEMKDTAKSQLGKNAYLDPKEYKATQEAAREKFRVGMREEGLYPEKKTAAKPTKTTSTKEAKLKKAIGSAETAQRKTMDMSKSPTKPAVSKPATKGFAAGKTLNATGKARYDELIKQGVKPKSAMNKALFAQEKAAKPTAAKTGVPAKDSGLRKSLGISTSKWSKMTQAEKESAVRSSVKDSNAKQKAKTTKPSSTPKFVQSTRTNAPATTKEVAIRSKGTVASTASTPEKVTAKPAAKSKKKFGKIRKGAKGFVGAVIAAEVASNLRGSTDKDLAYIQKLENRLAAAKGKPAKYKEIGASKNVRESVKSNASNLANLVSMGVVGQTRRDRMDELNTKITKAEKKKRERIAKQRATKPGVSAPGRSSSKINKTFKQASAASNTPVVGAGGSTISQGSAYRVKRGDTLSGIAKSAGVSLSDIMSANEKFKKNAKYKGGNMIFANTKVNIPKKK